MKQLFIALIAIMLVGAGCLGSGSVESDWVLGFTKMDGWHLVNAYTDRDERADMERDLKFDSVDAVIQTTSDFIVTGDVPETTERYGAFVSENYIKITMERMDARRRVPSDAEELGKGFLKVSETEYYLQLPDETYRFLIEAEGRSLEEAEALILSAKRAKVPQAEE